MKPQNVRTFAVVALAAASIYLLRSLIAPIVWAALIAIATWPLHDRLRNRLAARYKIASALLLTGAVVLFLVVPTGYISLRAWHELPALTRLWASSKEAGLPTPDWVASLPGAGAWAARQWNETLGEPGALSAWLHTLLGNFDIARGSTLVAFLGRHAMAFFFCVVVLFFLYLDGDALAARVQFLLVPVREQVGGQAELADRAEPGQLVAQAGNAGTARACAQVDERGIRPSVRHRLVIGSFGALGTNRLQQGIQPGAHV